jgi:hypothetical protein
MPPGAAPPGAAPAGPPGTTPPPAGYPQYAPQPYGAPPGYYPPPYYYYPPGMNVLPPATLPYEEGESVPQGYQVKTRPVRSLVIAGAVTFGSTYLVSLLTAATVLAASSGSSDAKDLAPLFAPVVGPFITIGTTHANGAGTLWLVLDGLAQTGGAVMLIYGLAAEEKFLQRSPQTALEVLTHPAVMVGPGSTSLKWKF